MGEGDSVAPVWESVGAISAAVVALAAVATLVWRIAVWWDNRAIRIYRLAFKNAVRGLLFTKAGLEDTLQLIQSGTDGQILKQAVVRQLLHVDNELQDAEDAIPNEFKQATDTRTRYDTSDLRRPAPNGGNEDD